MFRFSSAIGHFVKPNLSGGPLANAKPVVMSAFYTDAVKQSARNFGAKLSEVANAIPVLEPIVGVEPKEAC